MLSLLFYFYSIKMRNIFDYFMELIYKETLVIRGVSLDFRKLFIYKPIVIKFV